MPDPRSRAAVAVRPTTVVPPTVTRTGPVAAKSTPSKSARASRPPRPKRGERGPFAWVDVAVAAAFALVASLAAGNLPTGPLRYALTLPMLLLIPGYLLLQAFAVPPAKGAARAWQAFASLGISPALVGLLALSTSIVQGGFRLPVILVFVTLTCEGLAAVALMRRRSLAPAHARASSPEAAATGAPVGAPAGAPAGAATAKSSSLRP